MSGENMNYDFNEIRQITITHTISKLEKIVSSVYNEFIYTEKDVQELINRYFQTIDQDRIERLFKYNFYFNKYCTAACFNSDLDFQEVSELYIAIQRSKTNKYIWKQYKLFNLKECHNRIVYFPERIVDGYLSHLTSQQENVNDIVISASTLYQYIYQTIGHERRHMIQNKRCYNNYRHTCTKKLSNTEDENDEYQNILAERDADWYGHQFAISFLTNLN